MVNALPGQGFLDQLVEIRLVLLIGRRGTTIKVYPLFLLPENAVDFSLGIGGLLFHGVRHLWGAVGDLRNPNSYETYIKPKS